MLNNLFYVEILSVIYKLIKLPTQFKTTQGI